MDKIDYLYQYTSVEVLALILHNKKIRFSKLSSLDDPLEKYVKVKSFSDNRLIKKSKDLGDYCFVSCWTMNKDESIAMWDMYGDRKTGVRIGLPREMFDRSFDVNKKVNSSKQLFELNNEQPLHPEGLKVDYNRLDDPVFIDRNDNVITKNLGSIKKAEWKFQKEYRFRLYAVYEEQSKSNLFFTSENDCAKNLIGNSPPIRKAYIEWPLDKNALSQIKIIIGSNISEGKRILLNALIDEFGVNKKNVEVSSFTDRHR